MSEYSKYGVMLSNYDPTKEYVYKSFVDYYNNPIMSKIKNDNQFSVYMCKTTCLLMNKCRYLIATINKDNYQIGTRFNLNEIDWENFQTRVFVGKYDVPVHSFEPIEKPPMDSKIIEYDKNEIITSYNCIHFGIKVHLLHTKENNIFEYSPIGKLSSALETYNSIITFQ